MGYRRKYAASNHSSPACAYIASAWILPRLCLHGVAFRYSDLFSPLPLELPGLCITEHNLSSASVLYGTYAIQSIRHCEDLNSHSGDAEDITGMIIRGALSTPIQGRAVHEELVVEDSINPETSETTHQKTVSFPRTLQENSGPL